MTKQIRFIAEHVVEIRYKPTMGFLDKKALVGEHLSDKLKLPKFEIGFDGFNLWNEEKNLKLFVSYKNYGIAFSNPSTETIFVDTFKKMTEGLKEIPENFKFNSIIRHGVKSTFFFPWDQSFEDLRKKIEKNFGNISSEALSCFKRDVTDIGLFWNFKGKNSMMNTQCGPMRKEQALQYFSPVLSKKLPELGLFFLVDTYDRNNNDHDPEKITRKTGDWSSEQLGIFSNIVKLIRR